MMQGLKGCKVILLDLGDFVHDLRGGAQSERSHGDGDDVAGSEKGGA